jgi:hypothetical protein
MLELLKQMVAEDNGKMSMMRIMNAAWLGGVLVVWMWTSYHESKLAELPDTVVMLLGVLLTGKVIQRKFEAKDPAEIAAKKADK